MFRCLAIASLLALGAASARAEDKAAEPVEISFDAGDGVTITADLYLVHDKKSPMVVLFHQAGWSRGEYREIAATLTGLGLNALAVDARSGRKVNGVVNKTAAAAKKAKKGQSYLDALVDVRAALRVARRDYASGKLIAWGSSYSAALVLVLAGTEPELADATLAFAPGEYFAKLGAGKSYVADAAAAIETPVFVTSAKSEAPKWATIYAAIPSERKVKFVPKTKGNHGSKALWSSQKDSAAYWAAVEAFLASI